MGEDTRGRPNTEQSSVGSVLAAQVRALALLPLPAPTHVHPGRQEEVPHTLPALPTAGALDGVAGAWHRCAGQRSCPHARVAFLSPQGFHPYFKKSEHWGRHCAHSCAPIRVPATPRPLPAHAPGKPAEDGPGAWPLPPTRSHTAAIWGAGSPWVEDHRLSLPFKNKQVRQP